MVLSCCRHKLFQTFTNDIVWKGVLTMGTANWMRLYSRHSKMNICRNRGFINEPLEGLRGRENLPAMHKRSAQCRTD